jgi:2-dehydro-3-deoxygalactonokinase
MNKRAALITPDWIAVDWGTTNLRAWAMGAGPGAGRCRPRTTAWASLPRDGFEPALLRLIEPWLDSPGPPVVACGMVGSRQGWCEAPYRTTPCAAA